MLPHADGYALPTQPPRQQVYFYPYEEVHISAFDKAILDYGRPRSPMTRTIGNPADNSIQFKVPKSIVDQINHARAEPPTPIIRRENSPGGTDRARPPPIPPSALPMIERIQTVGQVDYDATQKKCIYIIAACYLKLCHTGSALYLSLLLSSTSKGRQGHLAALSPLCRSRIEMEPDLPHHPSKF